jgi:hypothetical protein
MSSNELFSDESGTPAPQRASTASQRPSGRNLGVKGVGRLIFGLILLIGTFAGITVEAVIAASPASATTITQCTAPASGGTAQTFVEGTAATYSVACEGESGVSGTTAYPSSITIASGALPVSGDLTLASGAGCAQSTSGSGTTEEYIEECKFSDSPTVADESATPYTATFTSTPGAFAGSTLTASTSGTLSVTISAPTVSCIDPAAAGTAATWHEGVTSTYTVECEQQSGVSSCDRLSELGRCSHRRPAGRLHAESTWPPAPPAPPAPAPPRTTSKSAPSRPRPVPLTPGSYAATFTATGDGGVGTTTSGALNITVNAATLSCIDRPRPARTATLQLLGTAAPSTPTPWSARRRAASPG